MRPMSRICRNCLKPAPRGPSRFCLGHAAVAERERARVGGVPAHLAVRLALLVAGGAVGDDEVRDLLARRRPSSPVTAVMQTSPEMSVPALVMNCLAPSITHSPSSQARARARVAGVGARLGLGQPERPEHLARAQPRQPLLLLLLVAEQVDRLRAERGVRAQRDRDRGVHARELLDGERVGERVAAAAAVLLREGDPHQVERAELRDDLVRERLRAVELLGDGRDLALGEFAHGAPDQLVVGRRGRSPSRGILTWRGAPRDGAGSGRQRRVGARELDEQAHAVARGALADVGAAELPGRAGDVEVRPRHARRRSSRRNAPPTIVPALRASGALSRSATVPLMSSSYSRCSGSRQTISPLRSPGGASRSASSSSLLISPA